MEISILLFDFILAIPLFFLLNLFEKRKNGTSFEMNVSHIAISLIYIVFVTGILKAIGLNYFTQNIFLVVFLESIYRYLYIYYVWNRESFINRRSYFLVFFLTLFFAYLLDSSFLSKVDTVFPDANEMKTVIWLLIILFLYISFKDDIRLDFMKESTFTFSKKSEYVVTSYAKLKLKYHSEIMKFKNKQLIPVFYAMMVYENYKQPPVIRSIKERIFCKHIHRYGIMQIESSIPITDLQSIEIAMEIIEKQVKKAKMKKGTFDAHAILKEYYQSEEISSYVLAIYQDIMTFSEY